MADKIDLVLEGNSVLNRKIDDVRQDLGGEIKDLRRGFAMFRKENEVAHEEILGGIKLS